MNKGVRLLVKFEHANTVANPTLNINSTGATSMKYNGVDASASNSWADNEVVDLYYDGSYYVLMPCLDVDDEPTAGSENLVKSGGVSKSLKHVRSEQSIDFTKLKSTVLSRESKEIIFGKIYSRVDSNIVLSSSSDGAYQRIEPFIISKTAQYYFSGTITTSSGIYFTDINDKYLGSVFPSSATYTNESVVIPENAVYCYVSGRNITLEVVDYQDKYLDFNHVVEVLPIKLTEIQLTNTQNNYRIDIPGNMVSSSSGIVATVPIEKNKRYYIKTSIDAYRVAVQYFNNEIPSSQYYIGCQFSVNAVTSIDSLLNIPNGAVSMRICSRNNSLNLYSTTLGEAVNLEQGVENSGKLLSVDSNGEIGVSTIKETDVDPDSYVTKTQNPVNIGKFLFVDSEAKVGFTEIPDPTEILINGVRKISSKVFYLGDNILSNTIGSGTGWTHNSGTYTHSTGNSEPLVFQLSTEENSSYMAIFKSGISAFGENNLNVSIGDGGLCDVYTGGTGPFYIGIVSDGGYLKITAGITYSSTVYDVELRKIVTEQEASTQVEVSLNNIDSNTMESNLTGWYNDALGVYALQNNQNGSRNIAIGANSLRNIKTGERNVGVGTYTLNQLVYGHRNVAIGADALYRTAYAEDNICIGKAAGGYTHSVPSQHTYLRNICIGTASMYRDNPSFEDNIMLGQNTAVGANGNSNSTKKNILIGNFAGYYSRELNICIGYRAGYYTKGTSNVYLGNEANSTYTTGDNCVCIGNYAKTAAPGASSSSIMTVNNAIAIGYQATATKSNQVVIGNSSNDEFVLGNKKLIFNNDNTVTWETV